MATIKQITDTTGVTHDIGCKWENIEKPGYIETPILHLNIDGENNGGKIIFGDMGDGFGNHDEHYACIEEIDDDVLNFRANSFNFEGDIIGNLTGNATTATTATKVESNTTTSVYYLCGTTNASTNTSGTLVKNTNAFVDTNGCLYSGGSKVLTAGDGDTKNTAGASTTTSKIYLVGATATSVSAQTYSNASVYATNGALTATTFVVAGTKATTSSRITSDASYNLYFTVGGKTPLVLADDDSSNIFVAPGSSYSNRYSLGTSTRKWKNVYATTFHGALSGTASSAYTAEAAGTAEVATTANCLADKSKGSAKQPVYINASGRPVACSFTADSFARGGSSNATLPATAGWYRIAVSQASIMNCEGIFQICGEINGKHTSCIITAGTSYGNGASTNVQVLSCHNWSTSALTKVRIVYNTSYTGNYAYLEVYSSSAAAISLTVRKLDGVGWTLTDPKTAGSIPSGYSSKEVTLSNGTIVAPTFMATSNIYASGSVNASAGFYETSDERLKDFSNKIDVDLDKISKIKKHRFTWKGSENKEQQIGVSAQEIQELYPEIVSEQDNGTLTVAYDKLSVVALAAIDELHKKNKELETRIELLESKLLN